MLVTIIDLILTFLVGLFVIVTITGLIYFILLLALLFICGCLVISNLVRDIFDSL